MRNFILSLVLVASTILSLFAQEATIRGIVMDSTSNEAIIGASVLLTTQSDSTLVGFDITTDKGGFKIEKVPAGDYFLQVTYVGYRNYIQYVTVGNTGQDMALPAIRLSEGNTLLEEVVVKADKIPILIKKDTIEYNAASFEVEDGATVEDLLRRLPGMQVDAEGNIKAQGKAVDEILVDGQLFFGSDPSVVAKNLPAATVDKVQVYETSEERKEEKNNGEETTETDTKTINLKLRDDKKRGYFGKGVAGGGTDSRFISELSVNRFDTKEQLSFIGKYNNINSPGFSFDDYVSFLGGYENAFGETGSYRQGYTQGNNAVFSEGEKETAMAGLNYSRKVNKKFKLGGNYIFKYVHDQITTESERVNFPNGDTLFTNNNISIQDNRYTDHNANGRLEWDIDSSQNLVFITNFNAQTGDNENDRTYNNEPFSDGFNQVLGTQFSQNENTKWNTRSNLNYSKKFKKKKGRTLKSYTSFSYGNDEQDRYTNYNEQELGAAGTSLDSLDRIRNNTDTQLRFRESLRWAEPVGQFTKFTTYYRMGYNLEQARNQATDAEGNNRVAVEELSRDFDYSNLSNSLGTTMNYDREKYKISIGMRVENQQLGVDEAGRNISDVNESYWFVLPTARLTYQLKQDGNIRLSYRSEGNLPSYSQLSPVTDNTNPTSTYVGNSNLEPSYKHDISANYYKYNSFNNEYIQFWGGYSLTTKPIINLSSYEDASLVETIRPENSTRNTQSVRTGFGYGIPLRFMKSELDFNGNFNYNKSPFGVNGREITQHRIGQNYSLEISNKQRKTYAIDVSYTFSHSLSNYSDEELDAVRFSTHSGDAKFRVNLPQKWILGLSNRVQYFPDTPFADDNTIWLISASIERKIFKDNSGKIRLAAIDLLNENKGISQQANAFYAENKRSNALGRFLLLTFHYDFSTFKGAKKNKG